MTDEQFSQKLESLLGRLNSYLRAEAARIYASSSLGEVAAARDADDSILPKAILAAALEQASQQFAPDCPEGIELLEQARALA